LKILFIGDIVGKIGRRMIKENLEKIVSKYQIDFVIANGENASHGKGLLRHHYQELIDSGIDVLTLGNHYDGKTEIHRYLDFVDRLVRPINILHEFPGEGSVVYDVDGVSIRVTNVLGSAFMNEAVANPYYALLQAMENEEEHAQIHIVDFHAEATGEKICLAHAFDGKITALLGTHTHVQTHDARILENGTAFISDVGMTGLADGSLGAEINSVTRKMLFGEQSKFEYPEIGRGLFSAVVIEADPTSGKATNIFPIYLLEEK